MRSEEPAPTGLVVVGVDGSANASAALRWALSNARVHGRRVHVVLCYGEGGSHRHPTIPSMAAEQTGRATRRLEAIIEAARPTDDDRITSEVIAVTTGGADEALLAAAAAADVLVVGRSGRGRAARLALGSVSSRCVERAGCPVVVVPDGPP